MLYKFQFITSGSDYVMSRGEDGSRPQGPQGQHLGIAIPDSFPIPGFRDWKMPIPGPGIQSRDWVPDFELVKISSNSIVFDPFYLKILQVEGVAPPHQPFFFSEN